jgi:hypothetical protein
VAYAFEYECECARIYAGISIAEWDAMPGTRQWLVSGRCKCDLVILYRMSNFIPSAVQDAQGREIERKQRTRGH